MSYRSASEVVGFCRVVLLETGRPFTSPASVSGLSLAPPGGYQIYRALLLQWSCTGVGVRAVIDALWRQTNRIELQMGASS